MSNHEHNEENSRLPGAYWRLFSASTVSNLGDGIIVSAGPLLALSMTDDTRLISAVSFAAMLPWLLLSLPAGVFLDRADRRKVMINANLVRCCFFFAIALAATTNTLSIYLLIVIMAALGVCELLFDMSSQAILPAIVEPDHLEKANSRLYISQIISNGFIGLPFGAWIFVVAIGAPFAINAIALFAAALLIRSIHIQTKVPAKIATNSYSYDLRQGFMWLWSNRLLRTLAIMLGLANMCGMFAQAVFVKFARDELGLGATGFGLLLAAISIGSVLGGLFGEYFGKKLGMTTAILGSYFVFGLSDAIPGLFPQIWAVALGGVIMSIAGTMWNVITVSARQRLIPTELFGRVNSVYRFIGTGTTAIGALIGGQIAFKFGLRATYLVSSAILLTAFCVFGPIFLKTSKTYIEPDRTPAPPSIT
jgi:MFS family permease